VNDSYFIGYLSIFSVERINEDGYWAKVKLKLFKAPLLYGIYLARMIRRILP
jgi:hypothetical protein